MPKITDTDGFDQVCTLMLYDSHLQVAASGDYDTFPGQEGTLLSLSGRTLYKLAQAFGFDLFNVPVAGKQVPASDLEFTLDQAVTCYGEDFHQSGKVVSVWAKITGPNTLDVKVLETWDEVPITREWSYCGRYFADWMQPNSTVEP